MPTAIQPGIYDPSFADELLEVRTEDAHEMTRRLAREEGLFVGISSGAAAVAALRVASELEEGIVVTIFPDAGYKYLSDKALVGGEVMLSVSDEVACTHPRAWRGVIS